MKIVRGTELAEAKRGGRLGIIFGFQDMTIQGENLDRFVVFHDFNEVTA